MPKPPTPEIVTFATDFGLSDAYVAVMKAAVLRACPSASLVDITHLIPPQDVLAGSIALERAIAAFPPGTVHVAVVDPGVGTARRGLIATIAHQHIICPDNGLITWAWRRIGGGQANQITWQPPQPPSHTFHGRDIFAPLAGLLAAGKSLRSLARPIADPILLDVSPLTTCTGQGQIIHIDHYGNATTNITSAALTAMGQVEVFIRRQKIGRVHDTYADVAPGHPLALIGSSDLLEIAVRNGSAAGELKLAVGHTVSIKLIAR
jgi:S-adenosylmethionine hydrolase